MTLLGRITTNQRVTIMKTTILAKLTNKRRSPANGSNTSSVGGVTSLILPVLLLLAIFVANGASVYATNSTLSLSIDNNTLSVDVMPTSTNGTFVKSDNSTISVTTNNYSGYTLSIAASSSTDLLNTADNTKTISSISSATSESDFSADTTTAATNYNGKWGYLPSKLNSSANTSFQPSPGTGSSGHTLDVTSTANATTPNTYTLAIGARVDSNTPTGSYSNTFVISAVANLINYTITYNKGNTTDTVSGLPSNTTGTISDPLTGSTNITLSSTEPTRDGYNFMGWCTTSPVAGTGTNPDTCSGTTIQASGTYNLNAVANPNVTIYALWQKQDPVLYNKVAAMSKGTQTLAELQAVITTPTSSDPSTDTSNSGVYEYDASLFGTSSDASNDYKIYYYRGILDSNLDGTTSTYGSNGDGAYYPNYVKLGNTCWRIVRTTGSGGVKMIYNGLYSSGTTANSCANAQTNAQVTTQAFGLQGNSSQSTYWYRNINRVGYTFNNTSSLQDSTTSTSADTVFGSNSNYSTINTADSNIKNYIENTWFTGSNGISAYESILEPSAGYCNDRTAFSNTAGTTTLSTIPPYATSSATMYFGAYARNRYAGGKLSLTCPASRNTVDLYTTASASNGNKQLAKPVALLTADEAALAGSGYNSTTGGTAASTFSSNYSYSSYLRSGSVFWLLSPYSRSSGGNAFGSVLAPGGYLYGYNGVSYTAGVRPAISLKEGTEVSSGSGTATDPWVIEEPKTMQSVTSSDLATLMPNTGDTTTLPDARDNQEYTIAKLADGKYWMTTNLNLAGGTTLNASDSNVPSDNYYTLPASSTSGFSSDTTACVYNSGNTTSTCTSPGCYSYYSWLAATAGGKNSSGSSVTTNGYNAAYSICPKGWRLPTSTTSNARAITSPNWKTGDWYALATAYGANLESNYYESAATFYNNAGPGTTPNFLLAGYYGTDSFDNGGPYGYYWSSTAYSSIGAYSLYFNSGDVYPANYSGRRFGFSVRCVYGS